MENIPNMPRRLVTKNPKEVEDKANNTYGV